MLYRLCWWKLLGIQCYNCVVQCQLVLLNMWMYCVLKVCGFFCCRQLLGFGVQCGCGVSGEYGYGVMKLDLKVELWKCLISWLWFMCGLDFSSSIDLLVLVRCVVSKVLVILVLIIIMLVELGLFMNVIFVNQGWCDQLLQGLQEKLGGISLLFISLLESVLMQVMYWVFLFLLIMLLYQVLRMMWVSFLLLFCLVGKVRCLVCSSVGWVCSRFLSDCR